VAWLIVLLLIPLVLGLLAWRSKRERVTLVLINVAAIILAIGGFEGYLVYEKAKADGVRLEGTITEGFTDPDDLLGYAPRRNARVTAREYYRNSLIYDVVYTIGPNGLRVTPPAPGVPKGCVVFFGDSITFGEGVNDEESFPYRVGLRTAGEYAIYNFAFSGYGPHQMLANLQARREEKITDCRLTHFIYFCIPEHVERVAGMAFWDKHGPRFVLTPEGKVVRKGNFDSFAQSSGFFTLPSWITTGFDSFLAWQKVFGRAREAGPAHVALLIAVIREAAGITRERYPGSKFDVILWDGNESERVHAIERGLQAGGIEVHRETTAIPDFRVNWRQYVLSEYDMHPNPLQLDRLARYVAVAILGRKGEGAEQLQP